MPNALFQDKRITIMGLGRFGGGVGVTRWLADQGADLLVTDLDAADKLAGSIAQIQDLVDSGQVTLRLGEHNVSDFTTCELVVANPAVPKPWENRFLRAAEAAAIPITTEIRLLVERLPNRDRTIGVTGTAGKSTTSAMIAHIFRELGEPVRLGGNIGGSLLLELDQMTPDDWIVLELSSAQLYWLGEQIGWSEARAWAPHRAVLTNLVPNHVDWHRSFDHYRHSKLNIITNQHNGDVCFIAGAEPESCLQPGARCMCIDPAAIDQLVPLRIPGRHNRANAALARDVVQDCLGDHASLAAALQSFPGLPHRLQLVCEFNDVRAFNDSKCTTPEACALAIGAFEEPGERGSDHLHLICGGYDKKIDLAPMIDAASRCAHVYTIGATGRSIADAVNRAGGRAEDCQALDNAVSRAAENLHPGAILLLSPGCASWDQFTNYEHRGERFIELIRQFLAESE